MDKINRPLVKSQARQLIRDKVFALFVISAIVAILANISLTFNTTNCIQDIKDLLFDNSDSGYSEFYDFDNGQGFGYGDYSFDENPFDNFEFNSSNKEYSIIDTSNSKNMSVLNSPFSSVFTRISSLIGIIFAPMTVTLYGFYVSFIKRRPDEEFSLGSEIAGIFKKSFDSTALKKFVIVILRNLFTMLWSILLVIPGIVYYYKSYFAFQLMCEYPNLKPTEALKLSDKMTKGNKSELFWLDLSFILWYCLVGITFGIASIYVVPYVQTTQALYYENFRLRAIAQGRLTEDDFLSKEEIKAKYTSYSQPDSYYNPDFGTQDYQAQSGNYYQPAQEQQNNYYSAQQQSTGDDGVYYYTPKTDENTTQQVNNEAQE